jgi:tetratricopeptide (TPR) repeat protein
MKMSFNRLLSVIIFLASSLSAADTGPHVQKGDSLYFGFDVDAAYAEYRAAYEQAPKQYDVLVRLVRVANDLGRLSGKNSELSEKYFNESLRYAEELRALAPDSAESYFCLAICYGGVLKYKKLKEKLRLGKEVEKNAKRAIEINPAYSLAYVVLGNFYREVAGLLWVQKVVVNELFGAQLKGTLEDSEKALVKALECDPKNPFACYELSLTYRAMKNPQKARECLQRLMAIPPRSKRELLQLEEAKEMLAKMER